MAKLNIRNRNAGKLTKDGKPKPPNWEYRFEGAKIDGKRNQISKAGFNTKREAEVAGTKALAEYNNAGLRFNPSEMSYADFLDYWFENFAKTKCKYSTQVGYLTIIEKHLKPALGHYKLKSLTPMVLQEFMNNKYVNGGYKKSTLKGILGVISSSCKYAVVPAQLLQNNPAADLTLPKLDDKRSSTNRTIISISDFNKMLERFDENNPFRIALMIGFHTGLRIGEVYALTWDDIDLEAKTLTVDKLAYKRVYGNDIKKGMKDNTKLYEKTTWYLGSPKTPASYRTIKLGDTLVKTLREYKKFQAENQLYYGKYYTITYAQEEIDEKGNAVHKIVEIEKEIPVSLPQVNLVLRKKDGTYSSSDSFKYASRVINHELHIKFNFHSLRHTHATTLIESGVSPKSVQKRLGHENITTTLQTYVHETDEMADEAVAVFESALKKAKI